MPTGRERRVRTGRVAQPPQAPAGATVTPPSEQLLSTLDDRFSGLGQTVQQLVTTVANQQEEITKLHSYLSHLRDRYADLAATVEQAQERFEGHTHTHRIRQHEKGTRVTVKALREHLENPSTGWESMSWYAQAPTTKPEWVELQTEPPSQE